MHSAQWSKILCEFFLLSQTGLHIFYFNLFDRCFPDKNVLKNGLIIKIEGQIIAASKYGDVGPTNLPPGTTGLIQGGL